MTDKQIKYMRDRFLSWTLPENLNPDGGITFKRSTWLDDSGVRHDHPMPVGTNFLDADQAEAMVRHMIDGLPSSDDCVAWMRWAGDTQHRHLVLCDSDAPGAFKVQRV